MKRMITAAALAMALLVPSGAVGAEASSVAASARTRTLVYVTKAFPYQFVVVRQRGTRLAGVAGTLNSGDYSCVRGSTRSGKLVATPPGGFVRAVGRGSGRSFRLTAFLDHPYQQPVEWRALVATTNRRLNQLRGMPVGDRQFLRDARYCETGGEIQGEY